MEFKYIQKFISISDKIIAKFKEEVITCTLEEVNELESLLPSQYKLPAAYKEFLLYGGKKIGHWFGHIDSYYRSAKVLLKHNYQYVIYLLEREGLNTRLPDNIFVIYEHRNSYFIYFLLTEGEDPPIYGWKRGRGGLEASFKINESFSDYLEEKIAIEAGERFCFTKKKIKAGKPPHSERIWVPLEVDRIQGIIRESLMDCLNFDPNRILDLEEAAALTGLDRDSYLEELSGWKCRKITEDDSEVRFFPPEA